MSVPLKLPEKYPEGYVSNSIRDRELPTARRIARRRLVINLTKWLLPSAALMLLCLVALWPEIKAVTTKTTLKVGDVAGNVESGKLIDARYNGVDKKGRPYTVTAASASEIGPDEIGMSFPKGDITLESGTWLMLTARGGTFIQRLNQLDLQHDVTLYRDDGTVLHTQSASIDLKNGAAAGGKPVHVEGPFGTLDAQGFTVMDKGAAIDFTGPAHVTLNGDNR